MKKSIISPDRRAELLELELDSEGTNFKTFGKFRESLKRI